MDLGIQLILLSKDNGVKYMDDIILKVNNLHTNFYSNQRCNTVLNGINFEVPKGKVFCIVGESGCGKSVTVSSIMQLLPRLARIEEGEIIFYKKDAKEIRLDKLEKNGKEMQNIRGNDIAMIFQDPMSALNPVYTIGQQIIENIRNHTDLSKKEAKERTLDLLKKMGMPNPKTNFHSYPHQLSGGMRQRAMIAMAMSCNPSILIADEPTTALDVTVQAQIFELMDNLQKYHETSIILITHDMGVVAEMADNVLVMYMGYVVEQGSVEEIFNFPQHPYTKALLRSTPIVGKGRHQKIEPIRGMTADPYNRPDGCQFAPRCDSCKEHCKSNHPHMIKINDNHKVRCFQHSSIKE
jgi:peptide/nickel transport system ATP-binding protein